MDAIIDAFDAHTTMSRQAFDSQRREQARRELLSIFTTDDILCAPDRLIAEEIAALN
jgi:hypothetical protein